MTERERRTTSEMDIERGRGVIKRERQKNEGMR